jgi:uncharacterized protein
MENLPSSRIAVFLLVVNVVSISIHAYVGSRILAAMPPASPAPRFVWPVLAGLYFLMVAALFLARTGHPSIWTKSVVAAGFAWMGLAFLLLAAGLAGDLSGALLRLAAWMSGQDLSSISRWIRLGLLACAPLAAVHGIFQALRPPEIREIEIPVAGLAPAWDGVRIAHVTDTHIGPILGRSWTEDLVRRVDSARPDIVVHTGDLVDGSVGALRAEVEPLARLQGREGTFFVTGNHEGYSGIAPWCAQMRSWGWDVLANESRIVSRGGDRLAIAGITDAHEGALRDGTAPDVVRALRGMPADVPVVLLAHQPVQALQAQGMGVSLQLSGHTHGGQIWPFHFLVRLQQPMVAGYARVGDVPVFTSRGAGFWGPPLRIGARAEVPILVLRKG